MKLLARRLALIAAVCVLIPAASPRASAQVIEFESNGLLYQTLTQNGLTLMFAVLQSPIRDYAVIQVAISNGTPSTRTVRPEDFIFRGADGLTTGASPARQVVTDLLNRAGRNDVIKLVSTYEAGLFGLSRFTSTNGYEARRQQALAEVDSSRLKAAAAASAIVLVATKLKPGESTDGAVFFPKSGKPLGEGKLLAKTGSESFEFEVGGYKHPGDLIRRP